MAAQWFLFYAMVAANLGGGGYALIRGRAVHRWVASVFILGVGIQVACWQLFIACGVSRPDAIVTIDMISNVVMCAGFLALALCYGKADWILAVMMLQAAQLSLDGFVFETNRLQTRLEFPDVANVLTILELSALAAATALRRGLPETRVAETVTVSQLAL